MWKRPEEQAVPVPTASAEPRQGTPSPSPPPRVASSGPPARLGPSLTFEGKLAGEEDLLVEGRFRGEIQVPAHQVTIGADGHIEGEIRASAIVVEGEVRGNLTASQQVLVRASGRVHGDIRAPRVALDQGCRFKGAIDMEPNGNKATAEAADRREQRREREREAGREGGRPLPVSTPAAS
jgi:cytoskeletal protein CcmA (bactofilin family)